MDTYFYVYRKEEALQPVRSITPVTTLLAGVQWLFFMFANVVVIPISIGSAFHLPPAVITASLERAFIYTGIACILQGVIGHRLPLMEGPAGLWWGVILSLAASAQALGQSLSDLGGNLEAGIIISGVLVSVLGILGVGWALRDAFVTRRLREAGAVILGKANLSEWANFRSNPSSSGWSGRGGQGRNPYVLNRTPCGSSSGSAAAIATNLATASLGTETDGSILCPSSSNAVVGIKPTVGLTSRSGVVPISHSQDTVGPISRTVADAAAMLGALTGVDPLDPATQESAGKFYSDYTQFLDPNGLRGARIGIAREVYFGYSPRADAIANTAIERMRELGAVIIDPADIPTAQQISSSKSEFTALLFEFKADLNSYLAGLVNTPVHTLADIIAFNNAHAEEELKYFGQELLLKAQDTTSFDDPAYLTAHDECRRLSRQEGIDAVMDQHQLDALVMPTSSPPWLIDLVNGDPPLGGSAQPAALAGYPAINVPASYIFDLPVGITFMGRAFSEPTLIKLAYAFEQGTKTRRLPQYLPTTP